MSERIYAWLLKLYPVRFREDYGASAMQLFRDRLRAERDGLRRLRFWLDLIADLAISLPREHWRQNPADPDVVGYRLSEEAVTAMTRRSAVAPALLISFFVVLGLTIAWLGNSKHWFLFTAYIPLAILAMGQFRSIRRFEKHWRSYQLILETDSIQQKLHGNDVTVLRSEVFKIHEDQHGLVVIGIQGYRPAAMEGPIDYRQVREHLLSICIPAGLTGYQQVREEVLQWTGRISHRRALWLKDPKPVCICALSLLPATLLVRSVHWFLIVAAVYYGLILLAIMMADRADARLASSARSAVAQSRCARRPGFRRQGLFLRR
jgi:hypothetical protein